MRQSGCIRPEITEKEERKEKHRSEGLQVHHYDHISQNLTGSYLIPCLCLSNENKGIGRYDGEAEVNEDD